MTDENEKGHAMLPLGTAAAAALMGFAPGQVARRVPQPPAGPAYRAILPANVPAAVLEPLHAQVGLWGAEIETWEGEFSTEPVRARGTQVSWLMSGGNALLSEFGTEDGRYSGTALWGWDASAERYSGLWIDSDTHLPRLHSGWWEPETRTLRSEADTLQPDGSATRLRVVQCFAGAVRRVQVDILEARTGTYRKRCRMVLSRRSA